MKAITLALFTIFVNFSIYAFSVDLYVNGKKAKDKTLKLGDKVVLVMNASSFGEAESLNYNIWSLDVNGTHAENTYTFSVEEENMKKGAVTLVASVNNGDGISKFGGGSLVSNEIDDQTIIKFDVEQNADRISLLNAVVKVNGVKTKNRKLKVGDKVEINLFSNLLDNTQQADFIKLDYSFFSPSVHGKQNDNSYAFKVEKKHMQDGEISLVASVSNGDGVNTSKNPISNRDEVDDQVILSFEVEQNAEKFQLDAEIFVNGKRTYNKNVKLGDKVEIKLSSHVLSNSQKTDFMELDYLFHSFDIEGEKVGRVFTFVVNEENLAEGEILVAGAVSNGDGISTASHAIKLSSEVDDQKIFNFKVDQSSALDVRFVNSIGHVFRDPTQQVNDSSRVATKEVEVEVGSESDKSSLATRQ